MRFLLRGSLLTLAGSLALAPDVSAQNGFGRAVAVTGDDVVVLKPNTERGPAAAVVFRRGEDGTWTEVQRLEPIDPAPGERFSGAVAAAGDALFVAAADPDAVWATHLYRRSGEGWRADRRLPRTGAAGDAPQPVTDLAGIMRVASPPDRIVAASADGRLAAVAGGGGAGPHILVLERTSAGEWRESARIDRDETLTSPHAIAIGEMRMAATVRFGDRTAVRIFDGTRDWTPVALLQAPAALGTGPRFGEALAVDGDRIVIGDPGAGVVVVFSGAGVGWVMEQTITSEGGRASAFGAALAIHGDELWVGSPGLDGGRGGVQRYVRDGDEWSFAFPLRNHDADPRAGLGASLALGARYGVAGAPAAGDGTGEAKVWARSGDGWTEAGTLEGAPPLVEIVGSERRCEDGDVAGFDCHDVDLLAFLPLSAIGAAPGERVSDLWGWTDAETGMEYALVGRTAGIALVDVSDPTVPRYLGLVPGNPSGARDVKVYRDHMFFTGDGAGAHGLVVFDLTRLRTITEPGTHEPDARYDGIASAHNLVIETETGLAIPVGASGGGNTCGGGLHMVDVREPLRPVFAGCYTDTEGLIWAGRTHDAQCVIYRGPDEEHQGRRICFASNETALRIVDVTDPASPAPIAAAGYPGRAYIHQGWLTEDQRYFFMNDELDELVGTTDRTRTLVWDVSDLDDPVVVGQLLGPDAATDHNLFIRGDRMYLANYQAGLRVVDISDPENPVEIGHFDTTPYGANPTGFFGGAWTAYPFLESGTILVSSINEGLFVVRPRATRPVS